MKTVQQWFHDYAISHQNKNNQLIHFICVPLIYFSIVGLLMSIDTTFLQNNIGVNNPLIRNWASFSLVFILLFYLKLSFRIFIKMLLFSILSIILNFFIANTINLFYFSIALFIIAWIGQFYGHHLEGKKPSFLKDLQFLLIGPPWVFEKMFNPKK